MEEQMVDVNKASVENLERLLKGVGRAKAEAIVQTRERLGLFQSIEEILQVPGIGKNLLEQNKDILKCCLRSTSSIIPNPLRRSLRKGQKSASSSKLSKVKDFRIKKMTNSNEKEKIVGHNTRTEPNGSSVGDSSSNYQGMECSIDEVRDPPNQRLGEEDDGEEDDDDGEDMFDFEDELEVNCKDASIVIPSRKFSDSSTTSETSKQLRQRLVTSSHLLIDNSVMSGLGNDSPHEEGTSDLPLDVPLSPMRLTDGDEMEMDNEEEESVEADIDNCTFDEEEMMVTDDSSATLPDKKQNKRKSEVCSDTKGVCPVKKTCKAIDTSNGCDRIKPSSHHCHKLPPPVGLKSWLSKYQSWTPTQKLAALDSLIDICDLSQVRHIHQVILPQFQRDFITLLPKELALYVLSYLEPKDLLSAAQTCKYWNMLTADNLLWRGKCREAGLEDDIVLQHQKRKKGSCVSSVGHTSPYKAAFMRQHQIEMNWRVTPLKNPRSLKGHDDHVITCLQFSGNTIVSGSDDNTLKVWNATSGKCMRTLSGHTGGVWSSQMCDNLIVSGSTDRMLKVWDADTGECIHTLYGHTSTVRCLHLHGKKVVSGSRDATLRVWDLTTGACEHVLVGHVAAVRCVQYNGKLVVSGAYDYMVKVWDPEKEECLHTLQGHTNRVYSLQFDGVHVVSGSLDTSIRVWDVQTGQCMHTLMGHQSLTSGMELKNNILISGNADSTVKVWDILTGQCLQTLSGPHKHRSAVTCLQFNNKFVVTSSDDGTVKLWDVKTGEFIRNLVALDSGGSGGVVWRIRASDTKLVCAVGSRNGTEETKLLVLDFDVHDSASK